MSNAPRKGTFDDDRNMAISAVPAQGTPVMSGYPGQAELRRHWGGCNRHRCGCYRHWGGWYRHRGGCYRHYWGGWGGLLCRVDCIPLVLRFSRCAKEVGDVMFGMVSSRRAGRRQAGALGNVSLPTRTSRWSTCRF
eukprot:3033351-Pyramimonas_sp.AAC.1